MSAILTTPEAAIPARPAPGPATTPAEVAAVLGDLTRPVFAVAAGETVGLVAGSPAGLRVLAAVGPVSERSLGDEAFLTAHGLRLPYMGGAMANGIASEDMVIALARGGYLGSFGAAGLLPDRVEAALIRFEREIPGEPFACNLIHSPSEERLEHAAVELYLRHGVRCVEASAFMDLTPHIVRYRVSGLVRERDGRVVARNRVIAKISRAETAAKFLAPAPAEMVRALVADGLLAPEQAELAPFVPMADDITVEGDSGGHTDRRPLTALLPTILRLRDRVCAEQPTAPSVRVGAAGGIGTPEAVLAAFTAGAAYVVTGSVNQGCVESGASSLTRQMLAAAGVTDCDTAPAADMFELGVELQVLRRGTLFPMRARRLYELYRRYDGIDAIPPGVRADLEQKVFRRPLDEVWETCREYFGRRDPEQLARAEGDEKRRMALVFRWYLGMSSRWSNIGEADRAADFQIWCGPAMGAFNDWIRGSYLEQLPNRRVADVAGHLLRGAAYLSRVEQLRLAGVRLPAALRDYRPMPLGAAR
jgi:trans-AT polyketide synthase, acyltransferase and oxidoreductase domains